MSPIISARLGRARFDRENDRDRLPAVGAVVDPDRAGELGDKGKTAPVEAWWVVYHGRWLEGGRSVRDGENQASLGIVEGKPAGPGAWR